MKISALQKNYNNPISRISGASTSFKGTSNIVRDLGTKIADNSSGRFVKFITRLGENNGEILNTLVTAVGTAFVAPIFIAFNPLSKEDKETKVYSALRQPISAVIALIVQIGVNTKFNNWLDTVASTGRNETFNLAAKPQKSYLKKLFKLQKPHMNRNVVAKGIKPENAKDALANYIKSSQDEAFWKAVNSSRETMKGHTINYKDLIDSKIYSKAKKELEAELKAEIKAKTKVKVDKLGKKDAKLITEDAIQERAVKLVKGAMEKEANVKYEIVKLAKSKKPFDEILTEQYAKLKDLEENSKTADGEIKKSIEAAKSQVEEVIKKLDNIGDLKQYKYAGKNFEEVLQSVKIKKLIKTRINNAEVALKTNKKWLGIVISLATLPFSCGLLNWAYPRIMEKVMPEISKAKKAKEAK